jgi:hypothetical protein
MRNCNTKIVIRTFGPEKSLALIIELFPGSHESIFGGPM